MVAATLIEYARGRLGDIQKLRWTDARLLQIVNQGQANICKLTGIYRKEAYLSLSNGETRYRLPADCMTVKRLEYLDKVIPIYNRNDLDAGKTIKEKFVCIKDNLAMGVIDIEPPIEDLESDVKVLQGIGYDTTFEFSSLFGVVTATEEPFVVDPLFGVVEGFVVGLTEEELADTTVFGELTSAPDSPKADVEFNNLYGVVTNTTNQFSTDPKLFGFISDSDVYQVVGQYGVVTSVTPRANTLRVFYDAVPTDLRSSATALVIPDMWEEAMMRYLVGTALQDDNDASNIQRGELELQKYTAEVMKARELSTKDFSSGTKEKYHTPFRRI